MADARVATAIAHWGPRFVANGVPLGDFAEVTGDLERWEDWCDAWSARGAVHEELAEEALASEHERSAGEHLTHAKLCHHFGKFLFVQDVPRMRAAHERAVACLTRSLPLLDPPGDRVEIPFEGTHLAGTLRRPHGIERPPVVVMVLGLDSTKEECGAYEQTLLDRGMATLAFDGPGQGEAEYDLPMRHDWEVPVGAVIDAIEARDDLDAARVGLWGVSLGGHYVVRAAALEPRVRAGVSLSGAYDVLESWGTRPSLNREAYRVRSHLASDEEVRERLHAFSLAGVAERVRCPLYVLGGTADRLVPGSAAQRIAAEAKGPTVLNLVEGGNHVVTNKPYRYRPQSADWLAEWLRA